MNKHCKRMLVPNLRDEAGLESVQCIVAFFNFSDNYLQVSVGKL